jgi:CheY-like chemotaxis protein
VDQSTQPASWLNLIISLVALGMGYGAFVWRTETRRDELWQRRCEAVLRLIPLFAVGTAVVSVAVVVILPNVLASVKFATFGGAALVIVLAALRQNLSLLELETGLYDLILMDCQMPELDGYEATVEIRIREQGMRHIPIVALTAHAMKGDDLMCKAAGMDDYLIKPLDRHRLRACLDHYLPSNHRSARPNQA